jgi:hypothetical protein
MWFQLRQQKAVHAQPGDCPCPFLDARTRVCAYVENRTRIGDGTDATGNAVCGYADTRRIAGLCSLLVFASPRAEARQDQ